MNVIPFTRPTLDENTIDAVVEVLRSGWLTTGAQATAFEKALSDRFGGRPVRVVSSATGGMEIALQMLKIGAGDEVITTPLSWVATGNVIVRSGARPVFVDVDPKTRNIDLNQLEAAITPKTRAILPVDLAGLPVDRTALYAIANQYGLRVIEDAAQSIGANWKGQEIGRFGDLVSISFHPNKNITSGEGGCIVFSSEEEAQHFQTLRLQGVIRSSDGEQEVFEAGGKHNLTDIGAAIGLGQLKRLDEFTEKRRALARHYFKHLTADSGLVLPVPDFEQSNWHMFQVCLPLDNMTENRGAFMQRLKDQGIITGVHYPAMHLFSLYRQLGYQEGDFPIAEKIGRSILTLPLFPTLTENEVEFICQRLQTALLAVRPTV